MYHTIGQRQGLGIGGMAKGSSEPWYVAKKDLQHNQLIAVQGAQHPMLFASTLHTELPHWINDEPLFPLHCQAKVRYRQADQACTLDKQSDGTLIVRFDQPQRAITPGQYAVFYTGDQCLGGAVIAHALDSS